MFGLGRRNPLTTQAIAGGGGSFAPNQIPSLSAWFDAEATSTMTIIGGTEIQSWNSRKGTFVLQNTIAGQTPSLVSVAGHNMAEFDGINDWLPDVLNPGSAVQPGSGDFSIACLFRTGNGAGGINVILFQGDDLVNERWLFRLVGTTVRFQIKSLAAAISVDSADATFSNDTRYVVIGSRDGTNLRLYWAALGGSLAESTGSPVAIGAYGNIDAVNSTVGSEITPAQFFDGDLGEWMFFKGSALTATQRGQLMGYFNNKWA